MKSASLRARAPDADDERAEFAADVAAGLGAAGQKSLPSKYFYDEVGSALFEAITRLPEYGLTRADQRILTRHARDIAQRLPGSVTVAELGSGHGHKVRPLLEALAARGALRYRPIDLAPSALAVCAQELGGIRGVSVAGIRAEYLAGLEVAASGRRRGERLLVLFVGSSIGNFPRDEAVALLRAVRAILVPGDALLLGTDLVKPAALLLPAYDDPAGVTAAFNRNLLARVNRELGADFHLRRFAHEARWNAGERRIEMHLRSLTEQTVRVPGAAVVARLRAGETVWTESSYKFADDEAARLGERAGWSESARWLDGEWPFAETLLTVAKTP